MTTIKVKIRLFAGNLVLKSGDLVQIGERNSSSDAKVLMDMPAEAGDTFNGTLEIPEPYCPLSLEGLYEIWKDGDQIGAATLLRFVT